MIQSYKIIYAINIQSTNMARFVVAEVSREWINEYRKVNIVGRNYLTMSGTYTHHLTQNTMYSATQALCILLITKLGQYHGCWYCVSLCR